MTAPSLKYLSFCLPLFAALLIVSCGDSRFSDFEKTKNGLLYKFYVKGKDTIHPKYGETIRLKMKRSYGDSTMENTELIDPDGLTQLFREPFFKGGIEEGILMMTIGDSAAFAVSTDTLDKYFPSKDSVKKFNDGDYVLFNVKLMNIQSSEDIVWEKEQRYKTFLSERKELEPRELAQYITDNHIDVKPSSSGMYYIEKAKGNGPNPKDGDSVYVNYTGALLDGTVFGSSYKSKLSAGFVAGEKGMLKGWNEAVKKMQKGTETVVIIPSALAFDSIGDIDTKKKEYRIPPYSPLRFELELIKIKPNKK